MSILQPIQIRSQHFPHSLGLCIYIPSLSLDGTSCESLACVAGEELAEVSLRAGDLNIFNESNDFNLLKL